ncbi:MAG: efflux RND transporter periplasmic adaptor subunit [Hydrogenothermaceae bacterium]|nr:efflux RND transporter periplasmic adaptor subunit [Hydrogenothermaceae bacterium]
MKFVVLFILFLFANIYSQEINLTKDIENKLNLKTLKVKNIQEVQTKIYPAKVVDNPTLSFEVSSPVDGIVEKVFVKQGDIVKKGSMLLKVYSPQIANIQSNIQMTKVRLKTAEDVLQREEMLYKEEVIPYSRFYSAKIEYEKIKGELDALVKALKSYGEIEGNSIILRSKIDGFVAESKAINGMPVPVGDSIMKIHSYRVVWVEAMVPFEDTKFIKIGQKAKVINPEGEKVEGKITLINHELDPKTSRNSVRVEVYEPGEVVKPNMFVNVEIPIYSQKGLFIPYQAVVNHNGKNFVFVKQSSKAVLREVKLGKKVGSSVEVISGLKEGEEIVIDGVIFLKAHLFGGGE